MSSESPAVIVRVEGHAGRITLNRPQTLNALTLDMVRAIDAALDQFEADPQVRSVVIDGAGDRALCAGGDIRSIHEAALTGDRMPHTFWAEEYRLNSRIAHSPKPIVAIMDGIVMGGGVGISAHAQVRVVTERSTVAMPEVGIGFAPDVGSTWLLSHAPGELGTHTALTAARLGADDAIACGLADLHVPSSKIDELIEMCRRAHSPDGLADLSAPPAVGALAGDRRWIDRCYAGDSVEGIVERLRDRGGAASDAAEQIVANSPTSLKVTLRALREARRLTTLEACLEMEYRISTGLLQTHDFVEGVRAAIIDKDRNPRWDPDALDAVDDAAVDRFFAPRDDDLRLGAQADQEPAA